MEGPIEKRQRLELVLKDFETFLASDGHKYYVAARQQEIEQKSRDIVHLDPVTREDEIESIKMRGDLRTSEEFENLFQDTVARLKAKIESLLELEQPSDSKDET